jgi:hypothetical protein
MQIRFADRRPEGDYALVLPVAGKDRSSLNSLGAAQAAITAALDRSASRVMRPALRSSSLTIVAPFGACWSSEPERAHRLARAPKSTAERPSRACSRPARSAPSST